MLTYIQGHYSNSHIEFEIVVFYIEYTIIYKLSTEFN